MEAWLQELKPGDKVICRSGFYAPSIEVVARVTKTLIVLKDGGRYTRESGSSVPYQIYSKAGISQATPEALDKANRSRLAGKLEVTAWRTLPLGLLRQIWQSLPQKEVSKEAPIKRLPQKSSAL